MSFLLREMSLLLIIYYQSKHIAALVRTNLVVYNSSYYKILVCSELFEPLEVIGDQQIVRGIDTTLQGIIRVTQDFISHFCKKL
ncbi:hypothetical protein SAMN04515674_103399 [Pseudarcicella hirudinis]|uniref:Uncharacterized protein n=1 Tax=Pseudarcicella hirudinis TaxID=1079859 RepID=A0A1I5QWR2_9BACT|nr:hypothetical protein SAMN04515674_103399 [Pseudarcicella hirudinis]